jgi:hypothetical protein
MCDRAEQEPPRVPDAGSREIRCDDARDTVRERGNPAPLAEDVGQLEVERDRMHAMVRREAPGELVVQLGQPARVVEATHRGRDGRAGLVGVAQVIRIVDLGEQREPAVAPLRRLAEPASLERSDAARAQRIRA